LARHYLGNGAPLHTTLPPDALDLQTQITFGGRDFMMTRLSTGIRMAAPWGSLA
jgi:hypothetical protein